ncbi:MAG: thiol reductant ABC exporter subunit CydD [Nocardioidaceae bacterium]
MPDTRATQRRLLRGARSARLPLTVAALLGTLTAGLVVAQAALIAKVVTSAFMDGERPSSLAPWVAALAAVVVVRALCAGAFETSGRRGAQRVMAELRERLAHHVLEVRPTGSPDRSAGGLVTDAVQGVESLEAWFARYLPQAVLSVTVPVVVLAFVLPRDPAAGLILLGTIPVVVVFMVLIGLAARAKTERRWRRLSLLSAHLLDVMRGLETLRAHDRESAQVGVIERSADALRRETMATLRVAFLSALVLELAAMLGVALVAATVGIQLAEGRLGLETGLAVLILAPELYMPIRLLGQQFHASQDGMVAAERIFGVLDEPAAVAIPTFPEPAPDPARGAVALQDVVVRYPSRRPPALDGLSLTLTPGEHVALVGPNGAGKSTAAALFLRLLDPGAGRVTCGGVDLRDVDPAEWRRRIAWLPQRPTILAATLEENVRLAAPEASPSELIEAVARAQLAARVAALPDGLATRVGEGGRPLSAGEAQRVALARAILRDAPLIVADEPTAHLDAVTAAAIGDALLAAAAGRTLLLITHRAELAQRADRTVLLADGGVSAGEELAAVAP